MVVVSDTGKVAGSLARKLKSAGAEVLQASPSGIYQKLETWLIEGEIAGVYFLPALDADPDWENTTIAEWKNARDLRIETLFQIAKSVPAQAFLIAATRMGGLHGVQNAENPLGGGVTGFIKALKRERPDQLLKVIDFEANAAAGFIAQELVSETLHDPVTVEIGRENDTRYGIALRARTG